MTKYVARQPIFDVDKKVYAYELLFRSGVDNYFSQVDGDTATGQVIVDSFLLFGIDSLLGDGKAFINFTRSILVKEYALVLPKEIVVVELLENVVPDREVVEACRKLKNYGYLLALDDFVYDPRYQPLLDLADIVKVDFIQSRPEERVRLADDLLPRGIRLLAEKVETQEDFDQALGWGYTYFQGYFFSKPIIVSREDIPGHKLSLLRILKEANQPEMNFDRLAEMIQAELSVSYKLLKLVNSAAFSPRSEIVNLKRALGYLGENGVKKWTSLLTLAGVGDDKPQELIVSSLIRAKFFENLAEIMKKSDRKADFFLMGLFSQLDAIVGRPIDELLKHIPLAEDCSQAIMGYGYLSPVIKLTIALERGRWGAIGNICDNQGIPEPLVPQAFNEAIQWPQEIMATFN